MAKDVKVGIVVTAKDETKAAMAAAAGGFQQLYDAGAKTFGKLGSAIVVFNQGFELAHKGVRMFEQTFGEAMKTSLEYRTSMDPMAVSMKKLAEQTDLLKARLGDALLPVVSGLAKAFRPAMEAAQHWLEANRQIIASKLLEYVAVLGRVLIDGAAAGAILAGKAWAGWLEIIDAVKLGTNVFLEGLFTGLYKVADGMTTLATNAGAIDLAKSLNTARASLWGLAQDFAASADKNRLSIVKTIDDLKALEDRILDIRYTMQVGWSDALAIAQAEIGKSTQSGAEKIAETQSRTLANLMIDARDYQKRIEDFYGALSTLDKDYTTQLLETQRRRASSIMQVGEIWGRVAEQMMADGKFSLRSVALAAIQSAKTVILSEAVMGGAFAGADAIKKFGIVGIAIGAAAAGVAFAMIEGLASRLPSGAQGMTLSGGIANRDTVPFLGMAGERLLTKEETRIYEQREPLARAVVVNINSPQIFPDPAALERHVKKVVVPALQRAIDDGYLRIPAPAGAR